MAYATPTVTRFPGQHPKGDTYEVTISGTLIGSATEIEITGLPTNGSLVGIKVIASTAAGGAGTTQPVIGTLTNPVAGTQAVFRAAAAVTIGQPGLAYPTNGWTPYYSSTGSLFYRGATDTGTCTEAVVIYIVAGWEF